MIIGTRLIFFLRSKLFKTLFNNVLDLRYSTTVDEYPKVIIMLSWKNDT